MIHCILVNYINIQTTKKATAIQRTSETLWFPQKNKHHNSGFTFKLTRMMNVISYFKTLSTLAQAVVDGYPEPVASCWATKAMMPRKHPKNFPSRHHHAYLVRKHGETKKLLVFSGSPTDNSWFVAVGSQMLSSSTQIHGLQCDSKRPTGARSACDCSKELHS